MFFLLFLFCARCVLRFSKASILVAICVFLEKRNYLKCLISLWVVAIGTFYRWVKCVWINHMTNGVSYIIWDTSTTSPCKEIFTVNSNLHYSWIIYWWCIRFFSWSCRGSVFKNSSVVLSKSTPSDTLRRHLSIFLCLASLVSLVWFPVSSHFQLYQSQISLQQCCI